MCRSPLKVALLVVAYLVLPRIAVAQSAIAGVVRDAEGRRDDTVYAVRPRGPHDLPA